MQAKHILAATSAKNNVEIEHRTGFDYSIMHKCRMKYNDKWHDGIMYKNLNTKKIYIRSPDDFADFIFKNRIDKDKYMK